MAAQPLPTVDLSGLDPRQIRDLNRELVSLSKVEIPRVRLTLRQLGGVFGRQATQLRGAAESIILLSKISKDESIRNLADQMEGALMATLSFMERSAFRTKQAVMVELRTTTATEDRTRALLESANQQKIQIEEQTKREITRIEDEISIVRQNTSNKSKEEVKKEIEILRERIREQERLRESTIKSVEAEEKRIEANRTISEGFAANYRNLLQEFSTARTDEEREIIQQRMAGQMLGEKQSLQLLKERFETENKIYDETATKLTNTVDRNQRDRLDKELKVRESTISVLEEEIKALEQDIVVREKGIERTTEQYKKGIKGFAGEVVSKSFTGGFFGALKGEGFGDLFTNLAKIGLERSGVLAKTMPKFLGGGNVGSFLFGAQSEEARKATALTSQQITTQGATIAKLSELITKQTTVIEGISRTTFAPPASGVPPVAPPASGVPPVAPPASGVPPVAPPNTMIVGTQSTQSLILTTDEIKSFAESIKNASEAVVLHLDTMVKSVSSVSTSETNQEKIIKTVTDTLQNLQLKTTEVEDSQKILKTVTDSVSSALQSLQVKSTESIASEQVLKTVTDSVSSALQNLQVKSTESLQSQEVLKTVTDSVSSALQNLQVKSTESLQSQEVLKTVTDSVSSALQNLQVKSTESLQSQEVLKTVTDSVSSALQNLQVKSTESIASEQVLKTVTDSVSSALQSLDIKSTESLQSQEVLKTVTDSVSSALQNLQVKSTESIASEQVLKTVTDSVSSALQSLDIKSRESLQSEQVLKTVTDSVSSALQNLQVKSTESIASEQVLKTVTDSVSSALQNLQVKSTESIASEQVLKTVTDSVSSALQSLDIKSTESLQSQEVLKTVTDSVSSALQNLQVKSTESIASEQVLKTVTDSVSSALVGMDIDSTESIASEQVLKTVTDSVSLALQSLDIKSTESIASEQISIDTTNNIVEALKSQLEIIEKSISESTTSENIVKTLNQAFDVLNRKTLETSNSKEILKRATESVSLALETLKSDIATKSTSESAQIFVENVKKVNDSLESLTLKTSELLSIQESSKSQTIEIAKVEEQRSLALDTSSAIVNINVDSNKNLVENITKTIEEMSKVSSSLETMHMVLDSVVRNQRSTAIATTNATDSFEKMTIQTKEVEEVERTVKNTIKELHDAITNLQTNISNSGISEEMKSSAVQQTLKISKESVSSALSSLDELTQRSDLDFSDTAYSLVLLESKLDKLTTTTASSESVVKTLENSLVDLSLKENALRDTREAMVSTSQKAVQSLEIENKETTRQNLERITSGEELVSPTLLPAPESRMPKLEEFVPVQIKAYEHMTEMAQKAVESGSIYTHDIHNEKILTTILDVMRTDSQKLSSVNEAAMSSEKISESQLEEKSTLEEKKEESGELKEKEESKGIRGIFLKMMFSLGKTVNMGMKFLKNTFDFFKNNIKEFFSMLKDTFVEVFDFAKEKFSLFWEKGKEWFGSLRKSFTSLKDKILAFFKNPREAFGKMLSSLKTAMTTGWNALKKGFSSFKEKGIGGTFKAAKNAVMGGFGSLFGKKEEKEEGQEPQKKKGLFSRIGEGVGAIGKGVGGLGRGIGSFGKGIGTGLTSLAKGVASFGNIRVIRGAFTMTILGAALIPFAGAMMILAEVPVSTILAGTVALMGMGITAMMLGKMTGSILKGSIAIMAIGAAMIPAAYAFSLMASVPPATILAATLAVGALAAIATTIGLLAAGSGGIGAAAIAIGAGLLALIGAAFIPLAYGISLLSGVDASALSEIGAGLLALVPGLLTIALFSPLLLVGGMALGLIGLAMRPFADAINKLDPAKLEAFKSVIATMGQNSSQLMKAGAAIGIAAVGVAAFGAAVAFATMAIAASQVASAIAEYFGLGKVSVLDQIFGLAEMGDKLMKTAIALTMIASAIGTIGQAFAEISGSQDALETIDELVSMDATQIQTLQDVSMAMDRVMNVNQRLREEKQMQSAEAAASAGGMGNGINSVIATSSVGNNVMLASPRGRNNDPSIIFSGERYYSMIYR